MEIKKIYTFETVIIKNGENNTFSNTEFAIACNKEEALAIIKKQNEAIGYKVLKEELLNIVKIY